MGVVDLWRLRPRSVWYDAAGAGALPVTAWWGDRLLSRTPGFVPGLGTAELALGIVAAGLLLAPSWPALSGRGLSSRLTLAALPSSGPSTSAGQLALGGGELAEIIAEAWAGGGRADLPGGQAGFPGGGEMPGGGLPSGGGGFPGRAAADPDRFDSFYTHSFCNAATGCSLTWWAPPLGTDTDPDTTAAVRAITDFEVYRSLVDAGRTTAQAASVIAKVLQSGI